MSAKDTTQSLRHAYTDTCNGGAVLHTKAAAAAIAGCIQTGNHIQIFIVDVLVIVSPQAAGGAKELISGIDVFAECLVRSFLHCEQHTGILAVIIVITSSALGVIVFNRRQEVVFLFSGQAQMIGQVVQSISSEQTDRTADDRVV